MKTNSRKATALMKLAGGVGYAVCVVLAVIVVVNATLIVKSYVRPDAVPDFFGYKPFIVLSGSMEPSIMAGDIIVTKAAAPEDISVGDVISFRTEDGTVVSHRVTEVVTDGGLSFMTKGDANTGADAAAVPPDKIEGVYIGRVANLGRFALFIQTPLGMLLFVIAPMFLFILCDLMIRRTRSRKRNGRELELEAELRALKAEKENAGDTERQTKN